MTYALGCDFAYGEGVTTEELKAAGVKFVCRYLSGGSSKDISSAELANYKAAGIAVVLNWETSGQMPDEDQGISDARAAQAEVADLGEADAPIIFSADFDPSGDTSGIVAYMRGVASVLGAHRTGLYGGYDAVAAFFDNDIGTYAWQTYAWSNGQWHPEAQLQQYDNDIELGPTQVDLDRAMVADFGQIGSVAPTPKPAPTPASSWPTVEIGQTGTNVKVVQYLLNGHGSIGGLHGIVLTVDGNFGEDTQAAVERDQGLVGLVQDGIVGDETWPDLIVTVENGSDGEGVEAVQTLLGGLTVDGGFGPLTEAKVKAFQTKHKLTVDGVVGPDTWHALVVAA
jgi:peptidoglycan hydrolase-like protein with peptidoglycan-binding domain